MPPIGTVPAPAKRAPWIAWAAAAAIALAAEPSRAAVFNPETFTLANGMQVVVVPNHRAPVVVHTVWYRTGSADDPVAAPSIIRLRLNWPTGLSATCPLQTSTGWAGTKRGWERAMWS